MNNSNQSLVVDVDLRESDVQRANFWFRLGKWSTRALLILLPLIGFLLLWRFQFSIPLQNPLAATMVLVLVTFPVLYPTIIWMQTKRGFGKLQAFQTRVQYAFSPYGYRVSDMKSASQIDWGTILRAVESKHSFHLFFHKTLFHTIPKRCFKSTEDVQRLRALLKQALGSKANVDF